MHGAGVDHGIDCRAGSGGGATSCGERLGALHVDGLDRLSFQLVYMSSGMHNDGDAAEYAKGIVDSTLTPRARSAALKLVPQE
jgi:hypothetical protein